MLASAYVALAGQRDEPGGSQLPGDPPAAVRSCTLPGSGPETRRMSPDGQEMTCRFIPCPLCLPE